MGSTSFVLDSPPGGSFALPDQTPSPNFRRAILDRMHALSWNRYPTIPPDILRRTPWDFSRYGASTIFGRGGEPVLLDALRASGAHRMIVPEHSYPGYARICGVIGARLDTYGDAAQLQELSTAPAAVDTVLVVTEPGNPLEIARPRLAVGALTPRLHMLVDAAYAVPYGRAFRSTVRWWIARGAAVCFTLSKMACFAGARFGGVVRPRGAFPGMNQDQRFWDVFSTALMDAFGDPQVIATALALSRAQEAVGDSLARLLEAARIPVVGRGGGCFATVAAAHITPDVRRLLSAKDFDGTWTRIDATVRNIDRLKAHL